MRLHRPHSLSKWSPRSRVATAVGAVTLLVLVAFALIVGAVTANHLRANFSSRVQTDAQNVTAAFHPAFSSRGIAITDFAGIAGTDGGQARIISLAGQVVYPHRTMPLGPVRPGVFQSGSLMLDTFRTSFGIDQTLTFDVQFALPVASLAGQIGNLELLLTVGVLAGTLLAYIAGMLIAPSLISRRRLPGWLVHAV